MYVLAGTRAPLLTAVHCSPVARAVLEPDVHWQVQLHRRRPNAVAALHRRSEEPGRPAWIDPRPAAGLTKADLPLHPTELRAVFDSFRIGAPSWDSQRHRDLLAAGKVDVDDIIKRIVGSDHHAGCGAAGQHN